MHYLLILILINCSNSSNSAAMASTPQLPVYLATRWAVCQRQASHSLKELRAGRLAQRAVSRDVASAEAQGEAAQAVLTQRPLRAKQKKSADTLSERILYSEHVDERVSEQYNRVSGCAVRHIIERNKHWNTTYETSTVLYSYTRMSITALFVCCIVLYCVHSHTIQ